MRILMLSWEYPPHVVGGMGKHVADLVPAIAHVGRSECKIGLTACPYRPLQIHVLTPLLRGGLEREIPSEDIQIDRVPLLEDKHRTDTITWESPDQVVQANQKLIDAAQKLVEQSGRFDLVHTHDWLTASAAVALKNQWHIPLIATFHATERGRGQGHLHSDLAHHIDHREWTLSYEAWRIIVCSQFMAQQLCDYFQAPRDKIDIVPNGVYIPANPFSSVAEQQAFRQRFAVDDEALVFSIGRIVYEKGLHVLLDAWPHVMSQKKARLIIAGSGPCLDALKTQAENLGITDAVTFLGFISDEERNCLYHVADGAVFPSLYEPFGIVVLEAFAASCPAIATQTGGLQEVVRHCNTGLLAEPGNVESLAQSLVHLLANPTLASMYAANALQDIRTYYNWQHIAAQTIATYIRVAEEQQTTSWKSEQIVTCSMAHANEYGCLVTS